MTRPEREKTNEELVQEAREFFSQAVLDGRSGLGPTAAVKVEVLLAAYDRAIQLRDAAVDLAAKATRRAEYIAGERDDKGRRLQAAMEQIDTLAERFRSLEQESIDRMHELRELKDRMRELRETAAFANSSEMANRLAIAETRVKELEAAHAARDHF